MDLKEKVILLAAMQAFDNEIREYKAKNIVIPGKLTAKITLDDVIDLRLKIEKMVFKEENSNEKVSIY